MGGKRFVNMKYAQHKQLEFWVNGEVGEVLLKVRLQVLLLFKQHEEHNKRRHVECGKVRLCICAVTLSFLQPSGRLHMISVHNSTGLPTSGRRHFLYGDCPTKHWTVEGTCAVTTCRVEASCSASSQDTTSFLSYHFCSPIICHSLSFKMKCLSFWVHFWAEWLSWFEWSLTGMSKVINMCYCSFTFGRRPLIFLSIQRVEEEKCLSLSQTGEICIPMPMFQPEPSR